MVRMGSIREQPMTLGAIRYRKGLTAMERSASICSVTRIVPITAVMADPTRPVTIKAVRTGPISVSIPFPTKRPVALASPLSESWLERLRG